MLTKLIARLTTKKTEYFSNWQVAEKACDSYANEAVMNTFVNAALAVGKGDAMYERDGRTFRHFADNVHLVAALQHVAKAQGHFQVLDFGGAFGNIYRQHRWFLSSFTNFVWCVVEQERFVETGKRLFTSNKLRFESTITEAVKLYQPNIAVLSSSLNRTEHPFDLLNELSKAGISYLFIDRTPLIASNSNLISCDLLPAVGAETAIPSWHFSEVAFKRALQQKYRIISEFDSVDEKSNLRRAGFFCEKI
jgi:putative methyltransferase (TIGR04325 family)